MYILHRNKNISSARKSWKVSVSGRKGYHSFGFVAVRSVDIVKALVDGAILHLLSSNVDLHRWPQVEDAAVCLRLV